ncbi:hypothetical protein ABWE90_01345 [Pasteurella multocida]|uniref:hypothetical protein n=1 Tax=Pasteurella multocida TaxID=747 RepID=UPI0002F5769E|nr:hypothetical protein [Pasteurella multocida]ARB76464.1 hypothetical protein A6J57_09605 [Pasteurella multocida]MCL7761725.1 hypothetical protein [Pasteurella multocida]MCL7767821.1 hypothetical protein [Pasteurella multocida]MCL7774874.1 hypothetical protein [Pasteurella multocida]MCL7829997.1 hypothetical protein [Pasteurella multocida]
MVTETHYTIDKNMKLLIEIDNSEPLQLSVFCQSMEGIAAEYRQFIQDNKIDIEPCEQHIYVEKITQGCFLIELAALVSSTYSLIEQANAILEFGGHLKNILDWAMNRGEKPERLTANMLKNANNILEPIAIDPKAQFNLQVSNNQGDVHIHLHADNVLAGLAQNNINRELKLLKEREENTLQNTTLYWSSTADAQSKAHDRAIIPAVSQKPVRVKFEDKTLKEKMILNEEYPYHKIFLVDVLVEYIDEEPVIYKILKLNNSMNKI